MTRSCAVGLIPAHAGKTPQCGPRRKRRVAHPRSRGENAPNANVLEKSVGSSPLTRGKPSPAQARPTRQGLIPAHAGKTGPRDGHCSSPRAHPRSRGENLIGVAADLAAQGSSPLTRGKLRTQDRSVHQLGLIPAHAGKTPTRRPSSRALRAHPPSRGENPFCAPTCIW